MFLRSIIIAGATLTFSGTVLAEELTLPEDPISDISISEYDWSGGYVGVSVGAERIDIGGSTLDSNHLAAGLYAGMNLQQKGLIAGVEGEVSYSGYDVTVTGQTASLRLRKHINGAIKARVGYAFDNFLLYGTAGVAVARLDADGSLGAASGSQSQMLVGYTVGGGLEIGLTEGLVGRLGYGYTDYGAVAVDTGPVVSNFDMVAHRVTAGMSYSF